MQNPDNYAKYYSESSFWEKLKKFGQKAGIKVTYPALLLYNVFTDKKVDPKIRLYIGAGLGYFILPIDVIPDFLPVLGFTDDVTVLMLTLNHIRKNITDEHRFNASETLKRWFSKVDKRELLAIENKANTEN